MLARRVEEEVAAARGVAGLGVVGSRVVAAVRVVVAVASPVAAAASRVAGAPVVEVRAGAKG